MLGILQAPDQLDYSGQGRAGYGLWKYWIDD